MKNYELIVVGGGLTGVAAAIAAACEKLSVLLIEQSGALGGAANISLVNPFMNFSVNAVDSEGKTYRKSVNDGIFKEICDELCALSGMSRELPHIFDEEKLKLVLDRMCRDAGVQVLFHSVLCGADCENGTIQHIDVATKAGKMSFSAKYFIDCTGDADLAVMCGFPYHLGREEDNLCQPMTLCFRVVNIDNAEKFLDDWYNPETGKRMKVLELYHKAQQEGKIKNTRENILIFPSVANNVIHFNSTRIVKLNPTDPFEVSKAEALAREQAHELFNFMQSVCPEFKDAKLLQTASHIGVRESRMIDGEYVINEDDILDCTEFTDSIAAGCYEIDIHNPAGSGTTIRHIPEGKYYHIPYRSLIPKNSRNLLVAGRCISSTHVAQSAYRVMPIVCCIGEGAGAAIAVACSDGVNVKEADIEKIHAILDKNNCIY